MAEKVSGPAELWHAMLGEMEKGFNAFANQAMASPEFGKVFNQVGATTADAQKQLGEMMERYLSSMNLPSRAQMADFGQRLEAIETQLAEITTLLRQRPAPPAAAASVPKPPRSKRPPIAGKPK
jgi:hypothetical protein